MANHGNGSFYGPYKGDNMVYSADYIDGQLTNTTYLHGHQTYLDITFDTSSQQLYFSGGSDPFCFYKAGVASKTVQPILHAHTAYASSIRTRDLVFSTGSNRIHWIAGGWDGGSLNYYRASSFTDGTDVDVKLLVNSLIPEDITVDPSDDTVFIVFRTQLFEHSIYRYDPGEILGTRIFESTNGIIGDIAVGNGKLFLSKYSSDDSALQILSIDKNGGSQEIIYSYDAGTSFPSDIALDGVGNIYWIDFGSDTIKKGALDKSGYFDFSDMDLASSITVDPVAQKLYVASWSSNSIDKIETIDLGDQSRSLFLSKDISPHSVAVNPNSGEMYLSSSLSAQTTIYVQDPVTQVWSPFITGITGRVYKLDIDPTNNRLFWATIDSPFSNGDVSLHHAPLSNGSLRTDLVSTDGVRFIESFSLNTKNEAVFYIYNTGSNEASIRKIQYDGQADTEVLGNLGDISTIKVDTLHDRLYWVDIAQKAVYKAHLDGTGATVVFQNSSLQTITVIPQENTLIFHLSNGQYVKADLAGQNQNVITLADHQDQLLFNFQLMDL